MALLISYDGTNYQGFQTQPRGKTVQNEIRAALHALTGEPVAVIGSSRTDSGVHARAQVVSFHTSSKIPTEKWAVALNNWLPPDIRVLVAREMPSGFHARKTASIKTYRYVIQTGRVPDVFQRRFRLFHPRPLDREAMHDALTRLAGTHDFTSFCSAKTVRTNRVRTICDTRLKAEATDFPPYDGEVLVIDISGNGFLYNMVRIIVGTLIEVGEGKRKADEMTAILAARDRTKAGPTAPAHGLTLWSIRYADFSPFDEMMP